MDDDSVVISLVGPLILIFGEPKPMIISLHWAETEAWQRATTEIYHGVIYFTCQGQKIKRTSWTSWLVVFGARCNSKALFTNIMEMLSITKEMQSTTYLTTTVRSLSGTQFLGQYKLKSLSDQDIRRVSQHEDLKKWGTTWYKPFWGFMGFMVGHNLAKHSLQW